MCRWLGPGKKTGQFICYNVLTVNGECKVRSSVIPVPQEDFQVTNIKEQMNRFTNSINQSIGNYKQPLYNDDRPFGIYFTAFGDNYEPDAIAPSFYSDQASLPDEIPLKQFSEPYLEELDRYIGTQVVIPAKEGEVPILGTIKRRKRDTLGNVIGVSNPNPILDNADYEIEFINGNVTEFTGNMICKALWDQVDAEDNDVGLLQEIIGHRSNATAISKQKGTYLNNGQSRKVITTQGWDMQIRWADGSTNWIPLHLIKESNPIQVAEYAKAHQLQEEPAFAWWISTVLR